MIKREWQVTVRDTINNAKIIRISNSRFFYNDADTFLWSIKQEAEWKTDVDHHGSPKKTGGTRKVFMDSIYAKLGKK